MSRWAWLVGVAYLGLTLGGCGGGHGGGDGGGGSGDGGGDAAVTEGGGGGDGGGGGGDGGGDGPAGPGPTVGGCPVFPANDHWNRDVSGATVDQTWTDRLHTLVGAVNLHPDVGNYQTEHYGIPYNVVPQGQAMVPITFVDWPEESDLGPYPFPDPGTIRIEGDSPTACDGDCHVLVVQQGTCTLYEGYACYYDAGWNCSNGAVWDLQQVAYGQREIGWTSADAAGLPILPGLVRYDEAMAGEINHAIRFTTECTRAKYVEPASHYAVPSTCDAAIRTRRPWGCACGSRRATTSPASTPWRGRSPRP